MNIVYKYLSAFATLYTHSLSCLCSPTHNPYEALDRTDLALKKYQISVHVGFSWGDGGRLQDVLVSKAKLCK